MLVLQTCLIALAGLLYVPQQVNAEEKKPKTTEKATTPKYKNVMYYGDWSVWGGQGNFYPKDIPAEQLTHLNFAFLDFDANGNFIFTDKDAAMNSGLGESQEEVGWEWANAGILNALQSLRADNPNMKLGVSIGGWSKSGDFSEVAADPQKRANFVKNAMKFIKMTNMDFVDIDWEYPASVRAPDLTDNKNDEGTPNAKPEDKENYIILLKELRAALNKQGEELKKDYELTVALPAPKSKLDVGINVKELFEVVDFANIMTYDMRGAWESQSGHHSGLYGNPAAPNYDEGLSVDQTVSYLKEHGAASEKIVIGAAFYSRGWNTVAKGDNSRTPGLFQPAEQDFQDSDGTPTWGTINEINMVVGEFGRASGTWSYRNIDKLKQEIPSLKEYWDDVAKAPYLYSELTGQFFTFENKQSVTEKANYVKDNNLGGMISWMQSQDKSSTGSAKRDELTKTIKEGLLGTDEIADQKVVYADQDIELSVGTSAGGYSFTIRNKGKATESNPVLAAVEKTFQTIKLPKFYVALNTAERLSTSDPKAGTVTQTGQNATIDLGRLAATAGRFIAPGASHTFQINTNGTANTDNFDTIHMTQRIISDRGELGKQLLFGTQNAAPEIKGATDKTINQGDTFNALTGVTATDAEDGDLTSKIKVTGTVDTSKQGVYPLTYTVTDAANETTTVDRKITVKEVATGGTITPNDFTLYKDSYVTGTFTGDVKKIKLIVEGEQGGEYAGGTVENGTIKFYATGKIKNSYDKVTIKAIDSNDKVVDTKEVPVKNADGAGTIAINDYVLGESKYVEGTYQGNVKKVQLKVGEEVYNGGTVAEGKISMYAHGKIKHLTDDATLTAFDARGNKIAQQQINIKGISSNKITPNEYTLYKDNYITGTYQGDVKKIKVIVAGEDGGEYTGGAVAEGEFKFYANGKIKNSYDKVTVVAYGAEGQEVDAKEVTLKNLDGEGTIAIDDYTIGVNKYVEGTYQGNVKKVQLKVGDTVYNGGTVADGKISMYTHGKITNTTDKVILTAFDARGNKVDQQDIHVSK